MPPAALICPTASSAPFLADFPSAAANPVSGTLKPIFTVSGVLITNTTGSLALAMTVSMIIVGLVGMATYKLAYEPLLSKPPFIALIASIALFIASEEIFRIVFGPYGMSYVNPPLQGSFEIFNGFLLKVRRSTGDRAFGAAAVSAGMVVSQHATWCFVACYRDRS